MISVVNGYLCRSSCDVSVARKGEDPRNPTGNPAKAEQLAERDGKTIAGARDARKIAFAGDQSKTAPSSGLGSSTPTVGSLIDAYA